MPLVIIVCPILLFPYWQSPRPPNASQAKYPHSPPPPETPCCIAFPTPTTGRSLPTYHPGEKQGEGGRAPLQSVFLAELFLLSPEPHNVRPSDLFMFEYLLLLSQTSVLYFLFRLGDSR